MTEEHCWIDDLPDEVNSEGEIGVPAGPEVPFSPLSCREELEGEGELEDDGRIPGTCDHCRAPGWRLNGPEWLCEPCLAERRRARQRAKDEGEGKTEVVR